MLFNCAGTISKCLSSKVKVLPRTCRTHEARCNCFTIYILYDKSGSVVTSRQLKKAKYLNHNVMCIILRLHVLNEVLLPHKEGSLCYWNNRPSINVPSLLWFPLPYQTYFQAVGWHLDWYSMGRCDQHETECPLSPWQAKQNVCAWQIDVAIDVASGEWNSCQFIVSHCVP